MQILFEEWSDGKCNHKWTENGGWGGFECDMADEIFASSSEEKLEKLRCITATTCDIEKINCPWDAFLQMIQSSLASQIVSRDEGYWCFWHVPCTQRCLKTAQPVNFAGIFSLLACTKCPSFYTTGVKNACIWQKFISMVTCHGFRSILYFDYIYGWRGVAEGGYGDRKCSCMTRTLQYGNLS